MGLWSWLFGGDEDDESIGSGAGVIDPTCTVNPATLLPMANEAVDVMGNPYGLGEPGGGVDHDEPFASGFSDDW